MRTVPRQGRRRTFRVFQPVRGAPVVRTGSGRGHRRVLTGANPPLVIPALDGQYDDTMHRIVCRSTMIAGPLPRHDLHDGRREPNRPLMPIPDADPMQRPTRSEHEALLGQQLVPIGTRCASTEPRAGSHESCSGAARSERPSRITSRPALNSSSGGTDRASVAVCAKKGNSSDGRVAMAAVPGPERAA